MSNRPTRSKTVGLLVGLENTFPGPFLDAVNQAGRLDGIQAEMVSLGGSSEIEEPAYAVIVDRISHEVPYYRAYLKSAVLQGTILVNDPFWWQADGMILDCNLAGKIGGLIPNIAEL